MIPKNHAKVNSHAICNEKVKNTTLFPPKQEKIQSSFTVCDGFESQGKRTNVKSGILKVKKAEHKALLFNTKI